MQCYGWKGGLGWERVFFFSVFLKANSKNAEVLAHNALVIVYLVCYLAH